MRVSVKDNEYLHIAYDTDLEYDQLAISFQKKIRNAKFRAKGRWDGSVLFLKDNRKLLPIGLWKELHKVCKTFKFRLQFDGIENIFDTKISLPEVTAFCTELMKHNQEFAPRPEQIEMVYKALHYRFCMGYISVAAGKTLVEYMLIMYAFYKKKAKQAMIVCPDADLVIQTFNEFNAYSAGRFSLSKMCMVHGSSPIHDATDKNIIIGNFQSFQHRDPSFFEDVGLLLIDEAHRAGSDTMKYIFESCKETNYRVGMTGSIIEDNSADHFTLLAYLGPIVDRVTKKEVIEKGYATGIKIKIIILEYLDIESRKRLSTLRSSPEIDGEKIFRVEQQIVRDSQVRLDWVAKFTSEKPGNTLVFFLDKKYQYGKIMAERIRHFNRQKDVYYQDGDTDKKTRAAFRAYMEASNSNTLLASFDTMSTGKSIKNIHNIVCAESRKSEIVISQSMGRGMRLHASKDEYVWYDIVDDFSIDIENYENRNILMRHMDARIKYYVSEGFDYEIIRVNLMENKNALFL